jgi:class 3 adenylate cyclase/tetratricopeptide (TPR) repeat protein
VIEVVEQSADQAAPDARDERELLAPYMPRLVVEWVDTTPDLRHRVVEGTLVFVDISGFTKLSEQLAKHGKIGAEELAATIGNSFVHLLDIAYDHGGRLIKFGGDALLLLFSGEEHQLRACHAAFEMRGSLRVTGRPVVLGRHVTLRMSVGIHSGRFDMFLVGDSHRELVVTGSAASMTVSMESAARAGEILVSPATASALSPADVGAAKAGGWLLRRAPAFKTDAATPRDAVGPGADLSSCVPEAILGAIRNTNREPEHRRATVAFVHFDGTDEAIESQGPAAVADYLDALVRDIQEVVDRQGVTFLGTDVDQDGGKVILVAGAPSSSGDDELHMLRALREFMDKPRSPAVRVGVNRGAVFAGEIGPSYRRTFTVMGDTVNLAARVMAHASPGQILATPDVLSRARSTFDVVEIPPFFVKGKTKAVEAFDVRAHATSLPRVHHDESPFVGRERELETWRALVGRAATGEGAIVEIAGEPGLGKSRLVEQFEKVASGKRVLHASCDYYESSTPFGALRSLMRSVLNLDGSEDPDAEPDQLRAALRGIDPTLVAWSPLVGAVVDIEMAETKESAELNAEFRGFQLGEVVTRIFASLFRDPTVVVVEDTHWMDDSSAELLRHVLMSVRDRPWLFVMTRRDVSSGLSLAGLEVTALRLEPLGSDAAAEFVLESTHDSPLPRHEIELLAERSGGNPLFLRELLAVARGSQSIDSLPDTVEAVITARIDSLAADDRYFLRRLSVLGRNVPLELLRAVLDDVPEGDDPIWERLDSFISADDADHLAFRHALLRDSAYDGLSYRLRRDLHGRAADAIAALAADRPEDQADLLSIHYFHAQRFDEAWSYSLLAAERAGSIYANIEAAEFYERALGAAKHLPELPTSERARIHEALGGARDHTGDYSRAIEQFRAARALMRNDPLAQSRIMLKLSRAQGWRDRYSDALRWITRALKLLDDVDGIEASRQRSQLLAWYGRFSQEQGRHRRAITWSRRAIDEAELVGEKDALANAYGVLDWAQMDLGTLEQPTNWRRGLELFEELGDLRGQATTLNSLGMFEYFRGRWTDALHFYEQAQERARRVGNMVQLAFYENNVAEIALDQGRIDEAEKLFDSVSQTWRAAGYRSGAAYVQCNLARVATRRGQFERAAALFEDSRREAESVGSQAEALEAGSRWVESQMVAGNVVGALARSELEIRRAYAMDGVAPQIPLLHRVRGAAFAQLGDADEASVELRRSLEAARSRQVDFDEALTLHLMAALGMGYENQTPADLESESARIFEALGVIEAIELLPAPAERAPDREVSPVASLTAAES